MVSEISRFNAELNSTPITLGPESLTTLSHQLTDLWGKVQNAAASLDLRAVMIGCLPTLDSTMLGLENMSDMERYRALNLQVMRLRKDRPMLLDIDGKDELHCSHDNVMLEAAATSLQIHFQVEADRIVRYFNASLIASAPLVALAANAPYVFGKDLWDETRIPIFEQAMRLPGFTAEDGAFIGRVTFGNGYLRESFLECFLENLASYPPLLPVRYEENGEKLPHLRLHNGTIWRWVRPIIGPAEKGKPHLRLEQRVPSAGPTITDAVANTAFCLGLVHSLAVLPVPPESDYGFDMARTSFYEAARKGLAGEIDWIDGKKWKLQELLVDVLVPLARKGLEDLGMSEKSLELYVDGVLRPRAKSGSNGAAWQRAYVQKHGRDFPKMVARYFELQEENLPVHRWPI